jgi:hypothetical protein
LPYPLTFYSLHLPNVCEHLFSASSSSSSFASSSSKNEDNKQKIRGKKNKRFRKLESPQVLMAEEMEARIRRESGPEEPSAPPSQKSTVA